MGGWDSDSTVITSGPASIVNFDDAYSLNIFVSIEHTNDYEASYSFIYALEFWTDEN